MMTGKTFRPLGIEPSDRVQLVILKLLGTSKPANALKAKLKNALCASGMNGSEKIRRIVLLKHGQISICTLAYISLLKLRAHVQTSSDNFVAKRVKGIFTLNG